MKSGGESLSEVEIPRSPFSQETARTRPNLPRRVSQLVPEQDTLQVHEVGTEGRLLVLQYPVGVAIDRAGVIQRDNPVVFQDNIVNLGHDFQLPIRVNGVAQFLV